MAMFCLKTKTFNMLLTITIASVSIRKEMLDNLLLELNKQITENNLINRVR